MTCTLRELCVDAHDPQALARFWAGVLDRTATDGPDGRSAVLPQGPDDALQVRFLPTRAPKAGPNRMHPDLTSTSLADQAARVARVLELGGRHLDVGQGPEATHVVLADPEGNELCVIAPGNRFLAGCPLIGALAGDGNRAVGCFWGAALGWPLVWDQDEETAIQAPSGGSIISWGGPPVAPKLGRNRWHLHLAPASRGDQAAEVERLLGLGATFLDRGEGDAVVLADPDGNELCVLAS